MFNPTLKRGGITNQNEPKHASVYREQTLLEPYIGSIGSMTRRYKDTHTRMYGESHFMRITRSSAFPNEGIATQSWPIVAQYKVPLHSSHTS